jgi:hypothetical protein
MATDPGSLRTWVAARRAAEKREREEVRGAPLAPQESLQRALRLIAFSSSIHGWPLPEDERCGAEDRAGYDNWSRLRAAFRARHGSLSRSKTS